MVEEINLQEAKDFIKEVNIKMFFAQDILFSIKYSHIDDLLTISFKIRSSISSGSQTSSGSKDKLLTIISTISIVEFDDFNQIAIKLCNLDNNLIKYNIYAFQNFNLKINENFGALKKISLKICLKECKLHTEAVNYLSKNYDRFYFLNSIENLSKQVFSSIFKTKQNGKFKEDFYVISLINWCKIFHN